MTDGAHSGNWRRSRGAGKKRRWWALGGAGGDGGHQEVSTVPVAWHLAGLAGEGAHDGGAHGEMLSPQPLAIDYLNLYIPFILFSTIDVGLLE